MRSEILESEQRNRKAMLYRGGQKQFLTKERLLLEVPIDRGPALEVTRNAVKLWAGLRVAARRRAEGRKDRIRRNEKAMH